MKEKFNSIDLFKFLMAIVVVVFHTNPFVHCESTLVNQIVIGIADISVPFFFMASGYLLAVRWGDTRQQREMHSKDSLLYSPPVCGMDTAESAIDDLWVCNI